VPDHHGHVQRLQAALTAIGLPEGFLEVLIVQFVKLLSGGEPVKMSKRAGEFVTLRELVDEVGADNARYFFLMRSATTPLDFDLDLAKKQSDENPADYVQYAHARIASLVRYAESNGIEPPATRPSVSLLEAPDELAVLRSWRSSRRHQERPRPANPGSGVSGANPESFHRFYHVHRVVTDDRGRPRRACSLSGRASRAGQRLGLLGVSAPERVARKSVSVLVSGRWRSIRCARRTVRSRRWADRRVTFACGVCWTCRWWRWWAKLPEPEPRAVVGEWRGRGRALDHSGRTFRWAGSTAPIWRIRRHSPLSSTCSPRSIPSSRHASARPRPFSRQHRSSCSSSVDQVESPRFVACDTMNY
jgi:hypothetical protein